jgi:hypothetical protein
MDDPGGVQQPRGRVQKVRREASTGIASVRGRADPEETMT